MNHTSFSNLARRLPTQGTRVDVPGRATYGVPVNLERPDAAQPSTTTGYGPERWHIIADMDWSYCDLWFCVVCLADHGGDWGALDDAIQKAGKHYGEQKWSHLRDLTERLDRAGLSAADLVGASLREPKLRGKARAKVMKSSLYRRDLTPPMRNPPVGAADPSRSVRLVAGLPPLTPTLVRLAVRVLRRR